MFLQGRWFAFSVWLCVVEGGGGCEEGRCKRKESSLLMRSQVIAPVKLSEDRRCSAELSLQSKAEADSESNESVVRHLVVSDGCTWPPPEGQIGDAEVVHGHAIENLTRIQGYLDRGEDIPEGEFPLTLRYTWSPAEVPADASLATEFSHHEQSSREVVQVDTKSASLITEFSQHEKFRGEAVQVDTQNSIRSKLSTARAQAVVMQCFDESDLDKDGHLTHHELMQSNGTDDYEAAYFLTLHDHDLSSTLDRQELLQSLTQESLPTRYLFEEVGCYNSVPYDGWMGIDHRGMFPWAGMWGAPIHKFPFQVKTWNGLKYAVNIDFKTCQSWCSLAHTRCIGIKYSASEAKCFLMSSASYSEGCSKGAWSYYKMVDCNKASLVERHVKVKLGSYDFVRVLSQSICHKERLDKQETTVRRNIRQHSQQMNRPLAACAESGKAKGCNVRKAMQVVAKGMERPLVKTETKANVDKMAPDFSDAIGPAVQGFLNILINAGKCAIKSVIRVGSCIGAIVTGTCGTHDVVKMVEEHVVDLHCPYWMSWIPHACTMRMAVRYVQRRVKVANECCETLRCEDPTADAFNFKLNELVDVNEVREQGQSVHDDMPREERVEIMTQFDTHLQDASAALMLLDLGQPRYDFKGWENPSACIVFGATASLGIINIPVFILSSGESTIPTSVSIEYAICVNAGTEEGWGYGIGIGIGNGLVDASIGASVGITFLRKMDDYRQGSLVEVDIDLSVMTPGPGVDFSMGFAEQMHVTGIMEHKDDLCASNPRTVDWPSMSEISVAVELDGFGLSPVDFIFWNTWGFDLLSWGPGDDRWDKTSRDERCYILF